MSEIAVPTGPPGEPHIRSQQRSRGAKPQAIRAAASRLFLAHGYGAVSVEAIAREAGVSKATIYAHFPDKANLFAALMREECEEHFPWLAALDEEPDDLAATLATVGRAYSAFLASPRGVAVFRMVVSEAPRFPELAEAFFENGPKVLVERLASFLDRARARGLLKTGDSRLAARQLLALLRGEIHLRAVLGIGPALGLSEIAAQAKSATDLFLKAYGP
ncbi:MAG TPA: TetR/AcrR family transcriptional regulator [Stellaceae bacterium]|nr:TetR/AcrR family transcriptional regulator [Stellaceae bacterium]